ncbi:MAG: hypothetical protein ACTHKE_09345 [Sphingomicrobium sp.]
MSIADALDDELLRTQYMRVAESYLKLIEIELTQLSTTVHKQGQH